MTLYSLDVVSVNISISFPRCKKARTHEGLQSSSRVRRVRTAPRRCSSPGPHPTNINSSLSRPPSRRPTLPPPLLLSTTLHFPEEEIFPFRCDFFVPSLHLASSVSLNRHWISVLSFKLVCYILNN